jgi:outer membrane murein-binding lipoprotein Lpp
MEHSIGLIQAYRQAPWRKQLQWIGLFAAMVVFLALVAGGYLSVTARAAQAGRDVQRLQSQARDVEQSIESLRTQLAELTSARVMEQRAEELGFVPVNPQTLVYLPVQGYAGRPGATLAPTRASGAAPPPSLPRAYTLSLLEWAQDMVNLLALQTGALAPGGD